MKNYLFIYFILFSQLHSKIEPNLYIDNLDNQDLYNKAIELRQNRELDSCLKILFSIKCCYLNANYTIAEIYLNEFNNYNIALDYFNSIISFSENLNVKELDDENNLYKKSLFMTSYIYSNYLGLYSKGYNGYNKFLEKFPEDELVDSVVYEIELLSSKEERKKELLLNNKN